MQTPMLNFDWDRLPGRRPSNLAPENAITQAAADALKGKRILVTGAAGCIGGALVEALLGCHPRQLLLLDISEQGIYEVEQHHAAGIAAGFIKAFLGSVCDGPLLQAIFSQHRPQIIFHAAAFKHVPLLERNPLAAISNNSLGTAELARAAVIHECEQLIFVSTDKAADPQSVMGVSKRIAEIVLLALTHEQTQMNIKIVRLGNVLNSPGSVVPVFAEQIESGKCLTVTHPQARRYFMTLSETVLALLAAASMQQEAGVFVPQMSEPVLLVDLARFMVARLRPGSALEPSIVFTGLRPGEKLEEVLISPEEAWREGDVEDRASRLRRIVGPVFSASAVDVAVTRLRQAVQQRMLGRMLETFAVLIPTYRPSPVFTGLVDAERTSATEGRP